MLKVTENNKPFESQVSMPEGGVTLSDLISQINLEINKTGKVITSFKLNDILYDANQIKTGVLVQGEERLDLFTDTPLNLSKKSINDILKQIDTFVKEIDDIVSDLIKGDKNASFKKFTSFLTKFWEIIQLLQTVEVMFSLDYDQIKINDTTASEFSKNLVSVLTDVKASMENEDMVTLTDILEYEIKDIFSDSLKKFLISILEALQQKNG